MTQSILQTLPENREAFEQVCAERLKWKAAVIAKFRGANGDYEGDRDLRLMWVAWQAALAAQPLVAAIPEPSDDEVDLLLAEIDQIARNYDHHDYGLPTCDDDSVASMRAQVQWFFESWTRVAQPPAGQQDRSGDAPAQGTVPAIGDYVLATKWGDGDPGDAWALGFYDGVRNERHMVKDSAGNQCRVGGYRMVGHVTGEVGAWLLGNAAALEKSPPGSVNLWNMLGVVPTPPENGESRISAPGAVEGKDK